MKSGLEDVVAAETVLSDVDGKNGRLIVRGVSLDDLVARSTIRGCAWAVVRRVLSGGGADSASRAGSRRGVRACGMC